MEIYKIRDETKGVQIGSCKVQNTGGKDNWKEMSVLVNNAVGVRDLFLVFKSKGDDIFRLDTWQFKQ